MSSVTSTRLKASNIITQRTKEKTTKRKEPMQTSNAIKFVRRKDYRLVKEIGQGGFGKTVLLEDEEISQLFICKKYSPLQSENKQDYFERFVSEIKMMYKVHHRNIVRIFNYYLYPKDFTGFILMDYVDGTTIDNFLRSNPDMINSIFLETIEGFKYLQEQQILHRDIRPSNILVSNDGIVKIIDFGFGKQITADNDADKSISLNWYYSVPDEFKKSIYDFRSEIYFVGKLFEEIILQNQIDSFQYKDALEAMTKDYSKRARTFFEVHKKCLDGTSELSSTFSSEEQRIYLAFVTELTAIISEFFADASYVEDSEQIISNLEKLYLSQMLEHELQKPSDVIEIFTDGLRLYFSKRRMKVETLRLFTNWFKAVKPEKRVIVLRNIWRRLDTIKRSEENLLPF